MKKQFSKIILAASTLFLGAGQAQAMVDFGLKGGIGRAKATYSLNGTDVATNTGYQTGFLFGGSASFDLGPVGLMADVLWAQRAFDNATGTASAKGNYLHIPVQAKFSFIPMFYISGGMYYSMALGDTLNIYDSNGNSTGELSYASAGFAKSDFGIVAGLGASIPLGVTSLSAEIRYNMGLKDINTGNVASKAHHLDFLVGVTF